MSDMQTGALLVASGAFFVGLSGIVVANSTTGWREGRSTKIDLVPPAVGLSLVAMFAWALGFKILLNEAEISTINSVVASVSTMGFAIFFAIYLAAVKAYNGFCYDKFLVEWALNPDKQWKFWDLSPEEQGLYLRCLDEANIEEGERQHIFDNGAINKMLVGYQTWSSGRAIPERALGRGVTFCEAREKNRACLRPAGHIDGLPMAHHMARPAAKLPWFRAKWSVG